MRTKAERRRNDWHKANRKFSIIKNVWVDDDTIYEHQRHRLSKGKVHVAGSKTRIEGYKAADYRRFESLQSSIDESDVNLKILPKRGD